MRKLIYKDECYKIIGACMEVHKILGPGLSEVIYQDALEYEFQINGIPYEREKLFRVKYKDIYLKRKYKADFVAYDDIILELKANTKPLDDHLQQTMNYMALAKSPVALIINFGEASLKYKRVIRSEHILPKHLK